MEKCLNTTLSTLAGGAAEELFQQALLAVLENIVDPNMDAKKKRTIEIQFTFLPDGKRGGVAVGVEIKKVGLAAPGGATTRFDLFEDNKGQPVAHEPERLDFTQGAN